MENKDLKFLKKHYGEKFAHLCRELFPTILEQEGVLSEIISSHFGQSRSLYDILGSCRDDFKSYIYHFFKGEKKEEIKVDKTPTELLDEAGYVLYPECQTEKDIQSFKKYWAEGEELCTFHGGRLASCRVWFAIKKDIDKIKREDFKSPERQDKYGTSAISIQFSKGSIATLSIKNRYNHSVPNPDSTFGNNLDNIVPGLTQSFIDNYGLNLQRDAADSMFVYNLCYWQNFRVGDDGRLYRANLEYNDINFCENNVILEHGHVEKLDKARYILADNYIIDTQKNEVKLYRSDKKDSFIESLGEVDKISTKTDEKGNKVVVFTPKNGEDVELTLNKSNQIIGYSNPNVTKIGDSFLSYNSQLKEISLPKLETVGYGFLDLNDELVNVNFPNLKEVDNDFLSNNRVLRSIDAPKLEKVGKNFLHDAEILNVLNLPNLVQIGDQFLSLNRVLTEINLPKLQNVGSHFLYYNEQLSKINLPSLISAGDGFLHANTELEKIELPNLTNVGDDFLFYNQKLTELELPKLENAGIGFLYKNKILSKINLPNLTKVQSFFLYYNKELKKLNLPKLETAGEDFLYSNLILEEASFPQLKSTGSYFLANNTDLKQISLPELRKVNTGFLNANKCLKRLSLPKVESITSGKNHVLTTKTLKKIYAPKLKDLPLKYRLKLTKKPLRVVVEAEKEN